MAFYISGPKLLFETTEISTQQESNYIYLYTTKFGTSIKIRLNRKFESTEFETMRVNCIYIYILHLTFLFSLFVFVSAVGRYFRIWTGQVPALFQIKSIIQQKIVHVTSGHMAIYGPVRHPKKNYMDLRSFGPYNILLVTDRSIYCHMTLSAMNYLLYISCFCQTLHFLSILCTSK